MGPLNLWGDREKAININIWGGLCLERAGVKVVEMLPLFRGKEKHIKEASRNPRKTSRQSREKVVPMRFLAYCGFGPGPIDERSPL